MAQENHFSKFNQLIYNLKTLYYFLYLIMKINRCILKATQVRLYKLLFLISSCCIVILGVSISLTYEYEQVH
jgi:hypothetical protein